MDEMRRMVAVLARAPQPAPVPDIKVTSPTFDTRSLTNQAKMVEVLEKCAQNLSVEGFTVEDAYFLTKEDNPRTKSWKGSVPARFKS